MDSSDSNHPYYPFEFTGNTREYFRIWIVNILLTVVTLGIYSAWAKVRNNRYFYGNTLLDGSGFDYTADPKKILIGRLIAVALLVAYQLGVGFSLTVAGWMLLVGMLLVPPIMMMSIAFRMRYSSWRGINFAFHKNYPLAYLLFSPVMFYIALLALTNIFYGSDLEAGASSEEAFLLEYDNGYQNLQMFIGILFFVYLLLFPWWQSKYYQFIGNRVSYGQSRFHFIRNSWEFYQVYLAVFAIAVLAVIFFSLVIQAINLDMVSILAGAEDDNGMIAWSIVFVVSLMIGMLLMQVTLAAFIKTHITNTVYSNLEVDEVRLKSQLKFGRMWFLYVTNTLGILFSLGLAIPWVKVRMARYRAQTLQLFADDLDQFLAESQPEVDAKGDAIADLFDFDLGL